MNQLFKQYFIKIASPYRLWGYLLLSCMVLIYHYELGTWQSIIYLPVVFMILYVLNQPLQKLVASKNEQFTRYMAFSLDIVVYFLALYYVDFNLILLGLSLIALFYALMYEHKKIEYLLVFILLALLSLTLSSKMDFQQNLVHLSLTSFVLYVLLLSAFIFSGVFAQSKKMIHLQRQNRSYYQQMTHYIDFSNQISRYAPVQLWQAIMRGESEAKIEYKRKKMTIFFSDIKGFTQLSETLIPEDLAFLLNEYLRHMTQIARQYNATIDKFMGDGILIFFGDLDSKGIQADAKACVNMAIAMQQQMKILRERWKKMGYPDLHVRMGITTGYCHVGNYGTSDRMAYTIVGREANLAARIQALAAVDEILVADSTYQLINDEFLCIQRAPVMVKGINELVTTWQVSERYEQGMLDNAQQYFDYEYRGFNLLLDLNSMERKNYEDVLNTLKKTIQRIHLQQQLTNDDGIVELTDADKEKSIFQQDILTSSQHHGK